MQRRAGLWCAMGLALTLAACGGEESEERVPASRVTPPQRETVFDPLTSTADRARGVQQTVDAQAAEQRRRIEDAER